MNILDQIREQNKDFVENENFKGVKDLIVDNYNDSAHFIYELLQNADDAGATEITFELNKKYIKVIHNGRLFDEKDLKSICSISMGTKRDDYQKIGRFGIGFKAVFVYTNTPKIYSGRFAFEIENLILPKNIDPAKDLDSNLTMFIINFDNLKTLSKAYDQIDDKLSNLDEDSLLFLSNINKINISTPNEEWIIEKSILKSIEYDDNIVYKKVQVVCKDGERDLIFHVLKKEHLVLTDYDKNGKKVTVENQSISIAFAEEENCLVDIQDNYSNEYNYNTNLFVFFPTMIEHDWSCLIHAPFITKFSRDTIAINNEANTILKENIGKLIAFSILIFSKLKLIDNDNIDQLYFKDNLDDTDSITLAFVQELKKMINNKEKIIPTDDNKYVDINHVLFSNEYQVVADLYSLLNQKDLQSLYGFSKNMGIFRINNTYYTNNLYSFLKKNFSSEINYVTREYIMSHFTAGDYARHDNTWFVKYIDLYLKKSYYTDSFFVHADMDLRKYPLIKLNNGQFTNYKENHTYYLNNGSLDESLLSNEKIKYIYSNIYNIKDYSEELKNAKEALLEIKNNPPLDFSTNIQLLKSILLEAKKGNLDYADLNNANLFLIYNIKTKEQKLEKASNVLINKWEDIDFEVLFKDIDIDILDPRYLKHDITIEDLKSIGCKYGLANSNKTKIITNWKFFTVNNISVYGSVYLRSTKFSFDPKYWLPYVDDLLEGKLAKKQSVEFLKLIKHNIKQIKGTVEWSSRQDYSNKASIYGHGEYYSVFGSYVMSEKWIYGKDGNQYLTKEITAEDLDPVYNSILTIELVKCLEFKQAKSEKIKELNKNLEKEGIKAITASEYEEYLQWKSEKEEKERRRIEAEASKNAIQRAMQELEHSEPSKSNGNNKSSNLSKSSSENFVKELADSKHKKIEKQITMEYKSENNAQEKEYLVNQYGGHCQICDKVIMKRNGDVYFNAINLLDTKKLKYEFRSGEYLGWNSLCLCPNCAAEFKYGKREMDGFGDIVKETRVDREKDIQYYFDVNINNKHKKITYTGNHLQRLRVALFYYEEFKVNTDDILNDED